MSDFEDPQPPADLDDLVRDEIRSKLKEKNLEYRTKVVEEAMTPLINEVTSLSEHSLTGEQRRKRKREPQKLSKLIHLVDMATRNFLAVGEEIAHENPDFQEELVLACDDVRSRGELLQAAAVQFSQSPCESDNRTKMTKESKELLLSVTRLMVVADMVDVSNLLEASTRIERRLHSLHTASTESELMDRIKDCTADITYITQRASIQPNDGRSEASLQLLSSAQVELNRARRMLTCTSKAFIQCPGARAAKENQEYVVIRLLDSLKTLSLLASGDETSLTDVISVEPGDLAICFKQLEENLNQTPSLVSTSFSSQAITHHTTELQEGLEKILTVANELASTRSTRDYRQHSLITLCGQLKTSMSHLVSQVEGEMIDSEEKEGTVRDLVADVTAKLPELRKELCRAAVEKVSDVFIGTLGPLVSMCEAAQEGQVQMLQHRTEIFEDHANSMEKVALLSCSLSDDGKANRAVRTCVRNVHTLMPQVINAAYSLSRQPRSMVALKSMSVFKEAWAENVAALADAVDSVTPLLEFMAVTEHHICDDGQHFLVAVETCNTRLLGDMVDVIRSRCKRLCHVVKVELKDNKSSYTQEQIHQSHGSMEKLMMKSLAHFCDMATSANEMLHVTRDTYRVNFKGLEDSLQKVVDNVRNVRRSILVTRAPEELEEEESDLEDLQRPPRPMTPTPSLLSQISTGSGSTLMGGQSTPQPPKFQRTPRHSAVFETVEDITKDLMSQLPPEHQAQLAKATEGLSEQQAAFEAEVSKWDDSGNNIVMLAKEICGMMVDMSNFARGSGPLHSTMDVIVAAKDIVRAAVILDGSARTIADHCPDTQCQRDIYAFLDRIRLYCHQLNITANVKADLKSSARDTMENASTLITTSKNLMTAVVDTVKTCYVASTAIARIHGGAVSDQFVQWRLTLPRKKKLVHSDSEQSEAAALEGSAALIELGKFKQGRTREPPMSTVDEIPYET